MWYACGPFVAIFWSVCGSCGNLWSVCGNFLVSLWQFVVRLWQFSDMFVVIVVIWSSILWQFCGNCCGSFVVIVVASNPASYRLPYEAANKETGLSSKPASYT